MNKISYIIVVGDFMKSEIKTTTKSDLVDYIADRRPDIKKHHISDIVQMVMTGIGDALVRNERVELRDFGVFSPKERNARLGRNPRTGAPINVPATRVCGFKVGKELKARLANSYNENFKDKLETPLI
jgi:integration host factor subunit beta